MFVLFSGTGVSFAWIANYFILFLGFFLLALFVIWKYKNPWVKLICLPISIILGYMSFKYFHENYWILNPAQVIWNVILSACGLITFVYFLVVVWFELYDIFKNKRDEIFKVNFRVYEKVSLLIFVIIVPLLFWSYFGFSQTYEVVDPKQEEFSVSFWGTPSAGFDVDRYNETLVQQELQLYKRLNATFIFGMGYNSFANDTVNDRIATALHHWATLGIHFLIDVSVGDFVTYYHCEEVNKTIDAIMGFADTYNFTNFRGITLDIEGSGQLNASYVKSEEAYEAGKFSFNEKFKEFRLRFPGKQVNGISMEHTMFDILDGDNDLQIAQRTVDHTLDFDMNGYMTYHTGFESPCRSSYYYTVHMIQGVKQFGMKFQPWVGWWYDPEGPDDPNVIETPFVYEQTIEQYKIAKSFGVKEVVFAPLRNFLGRNLTEGISRLHDLVDIKENGFETFRIPIHHNIRLFNDFPYYWRKLHPDVWAAYPAIFDDMMMGTPYQIFLISHILVSVAGGVAIFYLLKKLDPNLRE